MKLIFAILFTLVFGQGKKLDDKFMARDTNNDANLNRPIDAKTGATCPFLSNPPMIDTNKKAHCGGVIKSLSEIPEEIDGVPMLVQRIVWNGNLGQTLCFSTFSSNNEYVMEMPEYEIKAEHIRTEVGIEAYSKRAVTIWAYSHGFIWNHNCDNWLNENRNKIYREKNGAHFHIQDKWGWCGFKVYYSDYDHFVTLLKLSYIDSRYVKLTLKEAGRTIKDEEVPGNSVLQSDSSGDAKVKIDLIKLPDEQNPLRGKELIHYNKEPNTLYEDANANTATSERVLQKKFWALHHFENERKEGFEMAKYYNEPPYAQGGMHGMHKFSGLNAFSRVDINIDHGQKNGRISGFHTEGSGKLVEFTVSMERKLSRVYRVTGKIDDFVCVERPEPDNVKYYECSVTAASREGEDSVSLYNEDSCDKMFTVPVFAKVGTKFNVQNQIFAMKEKTVKLCTNYGICRDYVSKVDESRPPVLKLIRPAGFKPPELLKALGSAVGIAAAAGAMIGFGPFLLFGMAFGSVFDIFKPLLIGALCIVLAFVAFKLTMWYIAYRRSRALADTMNNLTSGVANLANGAAKTQMPTVQTGTLLQAGLSAMLQSNTKSENKAD